MVGVSGGPPKRVTPADVAPAFPAVTVSVEDTATAKRAARARAPEVAKALGLDPLEELQVRGASIHQFPYAEEIINIDYDRSYAGLPVDHGVIGMHLNRAGEIRRVQFAPTESIAVPSTMPAVSAEEAARVALATADWDEAVGRIPTFSGERIRPEDYPRRPLTVRGQPQLVIFVPYILTPRGTEEFGVPTLAWRIAVTDEREVHEEALVDAQTGGVLERHSTSLA